jgi:hypothetical protein
MTNQATYRRGTFDSQARSLAVAAAAAIDRRIPRPRTYRRPPYRQPALPSTGA